MPTDPPSPLHRLLVRVFRGTFGSYEEIRHLGISQRSFIGGFIPAYVLSVVIISVAITGHDVASEMLPTLAQIDVGFLIALSVLTGGRSSFHVMARNSYVGLTLALIVVVVAMAWNDAGAASVLAGFATLFTLASAWTLYLVYRYAEPQTG